MSHCAGASGDTCYVDVALWLLPPQVQWNAAEVSEVQFIELADLQAQMAAEPDRFTEWFRQEFALLNFFVFPGNN